MTTCSQKALVGFIASAVATVGSLSFAAGGTVEPDNSRVNQHQNVGGTADQQVSNRPSVEIIAKIRRALTSDKSLSTYAQNIKILTENGGIVLKGPVRTEQEKELVEAKAVAAAGTERVSNELTVAPK